MNRNDIVFVKCNEKLRTEYCTHIQHIFINIQQVLNSVNYI